MSSMCKLFKRAFRECILGEVRLILDKLDIRSMLDHHYQIERYVLYWTDLDSEDDIKYTGSENISSWLVESFLSKPNAQSFRSDIWR